MRKTFGTFVAILVFLFLFTEASFCEELSDRIGSPVLIETVQGGVFQGILRAVEVDRIEIVDREGQIISLDGESIETINFLAEEITKDTFFQDSASNRLIVMPTAFAMEPGEFHVADQEIAAVTMSYGYSEHITFWSGVSIPGLLLNGRFTADLTSDFAVSMGSFAGLSWLEDFGIGGVIPYGLASWGEPNNNVTVGGGPLFAYNHPNHRPMHLAGVIAVLGGKKVITSTTSLIFENWIIWGERREYLPMGPADAVKHLDEDDYLKDRYWNAVPSEIYPAICFRIAGPRLSWDIGAVVPLSIVTEEEVDVDPAPGTETWTSYIQNVDPKLQGSLDGTVVPIPILSLTYRID